MRIVSRSIFRSCRRFVVALALLTPLAAAGEECVGDCGADGSVTVDEIIIGVNIVLGVQSLSSCAILDRDGSQEVEIDELVTAVGFALVGCPVAEPSLTPTAEPTATLEPTPTASASASATPTQPEPSPATPTPTASEIPEPTSSVTPTAMSVPTPTRAQGGLPSAEFVAGQASLLANAMLGLNSVLSNIFVAITGGGASLPSSLDQSSDPDLCPITGTTTQDCTQMGSDVRLVLGSQNCVVQGPSGGLATFNGTFTLQGPGVCPVALGGSFTFNLIVELTPPQGPSLTVDARLFGSLSPEVDFGTACLVAALLGTVNGPLMATMPDGRGTVISFDNTSFTFTEPTFNDDCVPLRYAFTFDGIARLKEARAQEFHEVRLNSLALTQDASLSPVLLEIDGGIQSNCVGSLVALDTVDPLAVGAGESCPRSGHIRVSDGAPTGVFFNADSSVTIDADGDGIPDAPTYSTCLAQELLSCQ